MRRSLPVRLVVICSSGAKPAHAVVTHTTAIARSIANLLLIFSSFVLFPAASGGPAERTSELHPKVGPIHPAAVSPSITAIICSTHIILDDNSPTVNRRL